MTKVYANEEVIVIDDVEVVEAIVDSLRKMEIVKLISPEDYIVATKVFSDLIRYLVETDLLLSVLVAGDFSSVAILTYNVVAEDDNFFLHGKDERGHFIEV